MLRVGARRGHHPLEITVFVMHSAPYDSTPAVYQAICLAIDNKQPITDLIHRFPEEAATLLALHQLLSMGRAESAFQGSCHSGWDTSQGFSAYARVKLSNPMAAKLGVQTIP